MSLAPEKKENIGTAVGLKQNLVSCPKCQGKVMKKIDMISGRPIYLNPEQRIYYLQNNSTVYKINKAYPLVAQHEC